MQLGSAAVIAALLLCQLVETKESEQDHKVVLQISNAFSTLLYQALSSEPGNLVVSPLSTQAILSLLWVGSYGETARELIAGLRLPDNRVQVEALFKALLSSLQDDGAVTLNIANKMYLQQGFEVKDMFRQTAVDYFLSDAQEVDFANDTEAARININQWVENKTNDRIKDLITQDFLDSSTQLVLVNAIYFKGGWLNTFTERLTVPEVFHLTSNSSINVSMMHQRESYGYGEFPELQLRVLKVPYRDETINMLLLLPEEIDGLEHVEASIATLNLSQIMENLNYSDVIVSLPRFRIENTHDLQKPLKQLGIQDIFQIGANFSGITDQKIAVNKIVQKTFINVMEKGTEATAATGAGLVFLSGYEPNPSAEFKADHPFLFLILDESSGTILFMGRVAQPEESVAAAPST